MLTSATAAWVAHAIFWALLIGGVWSGELGKKTAAAILMIWIAGWLGSSHVPYGPAVFPSFVALLAVALVLLVFKGDLRV
jgi:hypothetical protein